MKKKIIKNIIFYTLFGLSILSTNVYATNIDKNLTNSQEEISSTPETTMETQTETNQININSDLEFIEEYKGEKIYYSKTLQIYQNENGKVIYLDPDPNDKTHSDVIKAREVIDKDKEMDKKADLYHKLNDNFDPEDLEQSEGKQVTFNFKTVFDNVDVDDSYIYQIRYQIYSERNAPVDNFEGENLFYYINDLRIKGEGFDETKTIKMKDDSFNTNILLPDDKYNAYTVYLEGYDSQNNTFKLSDNPSGVYNFTFHIVRKAGSVVDANLAPKVDNRTLNLYKNTKPTEISYDNIKKAKRDYQKNRKNNKKGLLIFLSIVAFLSISGYVGYRIILKIRNDE